MKFQQYISYTAVDFSTDPSFLVWRWFRTEESVQFWEEFMAEYPDKFEEISLAIKIVETIANEDNEDLEIFKRNKSKAIEDLTVRVHRYKKRKRMAVYSLSAVVVLACLFFIPFTPCTDTQSVENSDETAFVEISDKEVHLFLSSGERASYQEDIQVKYDKGGNVIIENEAGEILENKEGEIFSAAANRLVVPKGKRSSLLLADGSIIWVNSGTTVEFPSSFTDTDTRKIKIEGEIYIEVEEDTQRPFIVETPNFDVRVLGTKFNVSAYTEDPVHHVTVAEGLVSVDSGQKDKNELVAKNQQLSMNGGKTAIRGVNINNYTSWKDGILRFESESLGSILTRLSRYYDIHVICDDNIETVRCSGKLYLFDDWQVVLNNITKVSSVEYSVKNNEIIFTHDSLK